MKASTPKEVVNGWFEQVWNARDKNAIVARMAEDAVARLAAGGIAQFFHFQDMFFAAFPDLSVRILRSVGGDTQACLHGATGTHKGDFAGITNTNRKVSFSGMSFVTVRDGKITERWDCSDYGARRATLSSPTVER